MQNWCAACSESCSGKLCSRGNWVSLNFLKLCKSNILVPGQTKGLSLHEDLAFLSLVNVLTFLWCLSCSHFSSIYIPAPPDMHIAGCVTQGMNNICLFFKVHRKTQTRLTEVSLWSMVLFFVRINTIIYHSTNSKPFSFLILMAGFSMCLSAENIGFPVVV